MEEMNRRNDQGLGLPEHYTMMFFFCTDFFWKFPGKTSSNSHKSLKSQVAASGPCEDSGADPDREGAPIPEQ